MMGGAGLDPHPKTGDPGSRIDDGRHLARADSISCRKMYSVNSSYDRAMFEIRYQQPSMSDAKQSFREGANGA